MVGLLYESLLFASLSSFMSIFTLFIICSKGAKAAPSVAPVDPAAAPEGGKSMSKSPVSKSSAETANKEEEKKDEEKKEGEENKGEDEKKDSNEKDSKESDEKPGKVKEDLISASPTELRFETAKTTQQKLKIKNLKDKKIMFKIKATTTNAYLINPVFGKIEPNATTEVIITHRPSEKRQDKIVIVPTEMSGKEIEMAKTFKQIKKTGNEVTVKLTSF